MTPRRKWIATGAAACLLAAALVPWTFSDSALRLKVAQQVRDATGLIATSQGRTVLTLLPRPRIKITAVNIRDAAGGFDLDAESLRGDLRILPMFAGRLELTSASLVSPRFSIDLDSNPFGSGGGAIARAMEPAPPDRTPTERLGVVSLVNGTARVASKSRGVSFAAENVEMTIDWRSLGAPGGVKGSFDVDGKTIEIAAWIGKPANLLRGENSDVSLRVSSPLVKLDLNGALTGGPRLQFDGALTATSPSLRALAAEVGREPPVPGPLAAASVAGSARIRSNSISLSSARITLDGNSYEGALALDFDAARPILSGTLAADFVDLAPALRNLPEPASAERGWNRARFPLPELGGFDVDLRLSAARTRFNRTQVRDAGFSLLVNDGRAEISLVEAKVFGGMAKGRLTARKSARGLDLAVRGALTGVDSAQMMTELFRSARLNGALDLEFALAGEGESFARLVPVLRGDAKLRLRNGDISGLDLEQALRRLEKRPLSIASEMRSGRTNLDAAALSLKVEDGVATIDQAHAKGPGVEFDVAGKAALAERSLSLVLDARQSGPAGKAEDGPRLTLEISGDWSDPQIGVDARSLISRSQAAEPLMRSMAPAKPAAAPAPR